MVATGKDGKALWKFDSFILNLWFYFILFTIFYWFHAFYDIMASQW